MGQGRRVTELCPRAATSRRHRRREYGPRAQPRRTNGPQRKGRQCLRASALPACAPVRAFTRAALRRRRGADDKARHCIAPSRARPSVLTHPLTHSPTQGGRTKVLSASILALWSLDSSPCSLAPCLLFLTCCCRFLLRARRTPRSNPVRASVARVGGRAESVAAATVMLPHRSLHLLSSASATCTHSRHAPIPPSHPHTFTPTYTQKHIYTHLQ